MLAVARILRTGARLLLLDEITEGLAPVIVQKLGAVVKSLREQGYTIVMVEQNFRFAAPLADRFWSWSMARSSRVHPGRVAGAHGAPARVPRRLITTSISFTGDIHEFKKLLPAATSPPPPCSAPRPRRRRSRAT